MGKTKWEVVVEPETATEYAGTTLGDYFTDPDVMVAKTLAHIDQKRADLGLPEYDPNKFGRSGDDRMLKLEQMPLSERRAALYGVAAD